MNVFSIFPNWHLPGIFLLSAGLIALLAWPARRLGWIDHPSTRKHHRHPVPVVGGVAMCAAFCTGISLLPIKPEGFPILLIGMALLTLVGLYDDLHSSRPAVRFLFQAGAVLLMALAGHVVLGDLGDLFGLGNVMLGWEALLFTLFGVIGVINAFNMIDGLDGLAGGMALVATGWLLVMCLSAPTLDLGAIGALSTLQMVIAGFLLYNLRCVWRARASVFMGDAGSTMLGFVLGWFLIHLSQGEQAAMAPITAVWILALPLMDTVTVMVRRMSAGRSPFAADRQHLHHLLLGFGLSDGRAVAVLLAFAFVVGGLGVMTDWLEVPDHFRFYGFVGLFLLYFQLTTRMTLQLRTETASQRDRRSPPPTIDESGLGARLPSRQRFLGLRVWGKGLW